MTAAGVAPAAAAEVGTVRPRDVLIDTARLLCSQLLRLERQHRAGLTPNYGELSDLFDTRDLLQRQIDAGAAVRLCNVSGCSGPVTFELRPGLPYCGQHAGEALQAMRENERLGLSSARPALVGGGGR